MAENKMKQALILALEEEIAKAEEEMKNAPAHTFSKRHEKKIEKIIRDSETIREEDHAGRKYHRVKPKRIAAIIVAAILFVAAASVAVAVVKPQIYYIIKEKLISWDITFSNSQEEPSVTFEYIKPEVPEGYEVVEETKSELSYSVTYSDGSNEIGYEQTVYDGLTVSLDNERHNNHEETLEGRTIIVSEGDTSTTIVFENGEYVFSVDGTCDESILYDVVRGVMNKE